MSIFSALMNQRVSTAEEAFGKKDVTSPQMKAAIRRWFSLYLNDCPSGEEDGCQRIPVAIVNKLVKAAFSEYDVKVLAKGESEKFLTAILDPISRIKENAFQQALIGGECFLEVVPAGKTMDFRVIGRDGFVPFARDGSGRILDACFREQTVYEGKNYTLLERRRLESDGTLVVENRLYQSEVSGLPGRRVPLNTLPQYDGLSAETVLPGIGNLGMAQLKTPMFNCVDGSMDGVSVYAAAVGLIENINRNEKWIDNEFENGISRVIASSDLLQKDDMGQRSLSDTLFVGLDDSPENVGLTVFSPALREQSYLARKNEYLRSIESLIGFKRGILSQTEAVERTAAEITSSAGDYNLTIIDFQKMWESGLKELLSVCSRLGKLYGIAGAEKFCPEDIAVDWGDGVLFDRTRTWTEYQQLVQSGMLKPELALAWYFDLPCGNEADLEKIRKQYMPDLGQKSE